MKRPRIPRYPAYTNILFKTVANNQEQPEDNADVIMNRIRAAFEAMRNGTTDCVLFDRVASAFNVGLIRAGAIDPLAETTMQAGVAAMERADDIYGRHRRYGFYGPDIQVMKDALDLYEQILRLSTPKMMEDALAEAARKMIQQAQRQAQAEGVAA